MRARSELSLLRKIESSHGRDALRDIMSAICDGENFKVSQEASV